jgi:1-acyl-sn-glycerol-3-phosphate acyltransferase
VYKLWIGLVFWGTLLLLYPFFWVLLQRRAWFGAAFQLKRIWSYLLSFLMLCPVEKTFRGQFPKGPYIVVSNHSSYLDTVFMYRVVPDYFLFIGKGELLKWPLFSLFFRKQDIPVQRDSSRNAYQALQKAYEAIDRGEVVALYPEGTIPEHSPRMRPFKNGAFKMAIDKQVPIVPITWVNVYKVMKDPAEFTEYSLPQTVSVVIHEPIQTKGLSEEDLVNLRSRVFEAIDSALHPDYRKKP